MVDSEVLYDAIGVHILPCRRPGKFKAQMVAVKDGTLIEVLEELTQDRSFNSAHRSALKALETLETRFNRGKVKLKEAEQLSLRFE